MRRRVQADAARSRMRTIRAGDVLSEQEAAHYLHRDGAESVAVSQSTSVPSLASQSRVAFSSMASKTGCNSPGDELMTRSTSAVAVCCSSDCRQFVQQPRVLDGDDGLGGEVLSPARSACR